MAVSLGLSVLTLLCCAGMAAVGFIIKTWLGAVIALACGTAAFFLAQFLLNTTL